GEAALHGEWRGMLTPSVSYDNLTRSDSVLYVNRSEGGQFFGFYQLQPPRNDSALLAIDSQTGQVLKQIPWRQPPRNDSALLAIDSQTGQVLKQIPWRGSSYNGLLFRAATATAPARLLDKQNINDQTVIIERDPLTLAETGRWALPQGFTSFNATGTLALMNDNTIMDTRTRQLVPLQPAITKLLTSPPKETYTYWSSDKQWFIVEDSVWQGLYKVKHFVFISNTTGQEIDGNSQHSSPCSAQVANSLSTDALLLPNGGIALPYNDGVIELRRADGTLRKAVDTRNCQWAELSLSGTTLTFFSKTIGTVRLSDGQITAQVDAAASDAARLPILGSIFNTQEGVLKYQQADGVNWQLGTAPKILWLKANATWISKTEYQMTGEARVNDEPLMLTAKAQASGIELQAQAVPVYVGWNGELRRANGTLYAKINGTHGATGASQLFALELEGKEKDFAYSGELKR
ncbi:hypothetical protein, partial [Deinococcus aquatilis]|uniref:hypothetical protein n=1 Tax=Deinococcus aquatilis TaxID=519440 RepID=UPI000476C693